MKLELVNFRTFAHGSFSFESDYTLISGPSGSGKTSLLMAIHFAITGEGKKVVKHGTSKCVVTLTLNSISITRTKGPCRLTVTRDGKEYEDAEAQAVINKFLSNWELGYVSQRVYKSFLLMTPADKLSLIEKMAFAGLDIDAVQNKCKALISERKAALSNAAAERVTTEKVLTELGHSEAINFEEAPADKERLISERSTAAAERDRARNRLEDSLRTRARHRGLSDELAAAERELTEYASAETSSPGVESKTALGDLIRQTEEYNRYVSEKKRLDETTPRSGMTDGEIDACISDMIALKRITNSLVKLPKFEAELTAQNLYKQTHAVCVGNCPACNVSISSWNGELIRTGASKSITAVEAEKCERKRLQLVTEISNLKDLETERDKILSMYEGELDAEDQLAYLKHVKRNDAIWSACDALMREKPAEDVAELIGITQKREAAAAARTLVTDKISRLKRALLTLEERNVDRLIADTRAEIDALDESIEKLTASIKLAETRKQWERVRELRAVESDMAAKLPRAVKLAALIKTAERIALEDVISNINLRAGIYLSRFFPAVTASLVFEAKSLSEKIDLKIELDGEATDVNSLSGGECARLVLAFAIAMAEMNNIRALMLDESFAALDAETTECVLEAIKENYFGKVIVIAHQTTKGLFDDVVELKRKA